jgi:hypothetical protein
MPPLRTYPLSQLIETRRGYISLRPEDVAWEKAGRRAKLHKLHYFEAIFMLSSKTKFIDASIHRYLGTLASVFFQPISSGCYSRLWVTIIAMHSQIRACAKHGNGT